MTTVVLTGFNTDIEHSGTTYHVQTEDKGRGNPLVESLVYTSGEILYSRRTPYDDLVEQDVDKEAIATLMERQHRSIVDAVQTGGLARLTGKIEISADDDTTITHREVEAAASEEPSLDQVILDYLEAQRDQAQAQLDLLLAGARDEQIQQAEVGVAQGQVADVGIGLSGRDRAQRRSIRAAPRTADRLGAARARARQDAQNRQRESSRDIRCDFLRRSLSADGADRR